MHLLVVPYFELVVIFQAPPAPVTPIKMLKRQFLNPLIQQKVTTSNVIFDNESKPIASNNAKREMTPTCHVFVAHQWALPHTLGTTELTC